MFYRGKVSKSFLITNTYTAFFSCPGRPHSGKKSILSAQVKAPETFFFWPAAAPMRHNYMKINPL